MKNLRFLSYDPRTAVENLKKVLVLSEWLCGPTIKFKQYQIHFEIGKALSASLAKRTQGRESIEEGRVIMESLYGANHAIMQKYGAFISI